MTHVIPDIHTPVWTGTEVMNNAVALWPSHGDDGIITDAWFGYLNWLKKNHNLFFTSAVNYGKYPGLFDVLSFGLKYHENRVFTNGDVIVSLFEDNDLMITASTMFSAASPINLDREGHYRGVNTSVLKPILSLTDIDSLQTLSLAGLQALANAQGLSASN